MELLNINQKGKEQITFLCKIKYYKFLNNKDCYYSLPLCIQETQVNNKPFISFLHLIYYLKPYYKKIIIPFFNNFFLQYCKNVISLPI